ncbi:MAG: hypothetical protein PVH61_03970 [Candidatus Aminicenantes bacterium]
MGEDRKTRQRDLCGMDLESQNQQELIKSFCGGSRGAVFSKRAPLAAGGESGGGFWMKKN